MYNSQGFFFGTISFKPSPKETSEDAFHILRKKLVMAKCWGLLLYVKLQYCKVTLGIGIFNK